MHVSEWLGENNKLGIDIWNRKYRYNDEDFETWLDRVSGGNEEIKRLIKEKKFLFSGRILANRGLQKYGRKITLSNCYVITPPEDNIEGIFNCAKKLARTYSYGGGCGIDVSKLAPRGAKINNAARETTGAVSFMDLYSLVTELIGQQGRRGALMISIDCTHPDLEEFIKIKSDLNKITKANISIRINNDFMKAVKENKDWELTYTRKETGQVIRKTVKARELFHLMCKMNWDYAEPGILNWDRITKWNLLSEDENFAYAGVNPCAEEPLPAGGSCLLGSINLSELINNPFASNSSFDYITLREVVTQAVIGLNEVLHEGLPLHPLQEQRDSVNNWRQIGLGIFGWHDALIKLGIRYGSEESLELADKIGFEIANTAIYTSATLTDKYGIYPMYNAKAVLNSPYFIANTNEDTKKIVEEKGLANSQLLTIAPTGSLGTMLCVSTGIEPIYNISYTRKTESLFGKDKYYKVYTHIVEQYMSINNITEEEDLPSFINTAMTLNYKERIEMQSIWQKHIDASISSTINVPNDFTVQEVEDLYMLAWEKGLKGVTIFRDNCARVGILTNDIKTSDNSESMELPRGFIEDVPEGLVYRKYKLRNGCGNLYFFVGVDEVDKKIYDVFTNTNAVGGCTINTQANSRLLSAAIRGGIPIEYLIEQLEKSGSCASYQKLRGIQTGMTKVRNMILNEVPKETIDKIDEIIGVPVSEGKSCPSSIAIVLKNILKEFKEEEYEDMPYNIISKEEVIKVKAESAKVQELKINECQHKNMRMTEGCVICPDCGYSKCSD